MDCRLWGASHVTYRWLRTFCMWLLLLLLCWVRGARSSVQLHRSYGPLRPAPQRP